MKLPARKVKIGYRDYAICRKRLPAPDFGNTDFRNAVITLAYGQSDADLASTLWHEIRHAMRWENHLDSKDGEEPDIVRQTQMDCSVMRDNKPLIRWIIDNL